MAESRLPLLVSRDSVPLEAAQMVDESSASAQKLAQDRVADYASRQERLKRLWIDVHFGNKKGSKLAAAGAMAVQSPVSSLKLPASKRSPKRSTSVPGIRSRVPNRPAVANVSRQAGALSAAQMRELMSRDITPEDYEMLLLLDENVKPKFKRLTPEAASSLPHAVPSGNWVGDSCAICLQDLDAAEDLRSLPGCGHTFHAACIGQWLTTSRASCPIDSLDVLLQCTSCQ